MAASLLASVAAVAIARQLHFHFVPLSAADAFSHIVLNSLLFGSLYISICRSPLYMEAANLFFKLAGLSARCFPWTRRGKSSPAPSTNRKDTVEAFTATGGEE